MGIHKLLVVDKEDRLRGLYTLSDIERIMEESREHVKPAVIPNSDSLRSRCFGSSEARRRD